MTTKFVSSIKTAVLFCFVLVSIIACEKDFENIGVNIVDNNLFETNFQDFEVVANTIDVEASRVDVLPVRNLGILKDVDNFGELRASLISQIGLAASSISFGTNPVIDTVILDIPYFYTRNREDNSDGTPNFTLDSVFGNQDTEYKLKVSRLTTFLNTLDPEDPAKNKRYYSNEAYSISDVLYYDSFKPNKNDTVLYVERPLVIIDDNGAIDIDTIKKQNINPSIKLPLDKNIIKNILIDNATTSDLSSFTNFSNYFRGIKIDAEEIAANGGSLMTLNTQQASVTIYYTNEVTASGENTPKKTKQTLTLPFLGITTSTYNRNYSGADVLNYADADLDEGADNVFIQGSAGNNAEIKLFKDADIDAYRNKNWLINGAILDLYINDSTDIGVPKKLYLYKANGTVIKDVISEALVQGIGGNLVRDDNGKPDFYRFFITDYISDLLAKNSALENIPLVLKTHHSTDNAQSATDTIVRDFSWNVKGVVLKGNNLPKINNELNPERIKLRVYYSEN